MSKRLRAVAVEQAALHEIVKAIRATSELEKTLGTVLDVLSKRFDVEHAMISLVNSAGELELVASSGGDLEHSRRHTESEGEAPLPMMSLVGVPIRAHGRDLGVLSCARRRAEPYSAFQQDVRLLTIVAHLIGEAVHLAENAANADRAWASAAALSVH
jgi:transcriptional regulator with GAF, ATPase, and Fis domain